MRRHTMSAVLGIIVLAALSQRALTESPGGEESAAPESVTDQPVVRRSASYTASLGDRSEAQEEAAEQQRQRVQSAYRDDQVLVSPAPGEALAAVAAAHGLEVAQAVGASGYGALSVPPGQLVGAMERLRDDPAVDAVAPNGLTAGASASAASLQASANKNAAEAAKREAEAQEAEALLDWLIETRASTKDIDDARDHAENAREKAEEAYEDYEEAQAEADARGQLEYRAKLREIQLHLKCTKHPKWDESFEHWEEIPEPAYAPWTVAVLDTGVAYESWEDKQGRYVPAESLSSSAVVAPRDFINGDSHANDDHQHGTHIASIIASDGDLAGLAPGVTLMPVKVLDEENQGTELALVEGILHAVDSGADVINMSLSFGEGYLPSPLLLDALEQAYAAGIVMVAASGNASSGDATWPAASHRVAAVASSGIIDHSRHLMMSEYANTSPQVDLTAPGGIVGRDQDGDGFDDGILAETIAPGDPSTTGYWFYAGTSQAAAVVSGAAVRLLARGVPPEDVIRALAAEAEDDLDGDAYLSGWGAGTLDLTDTERLTERPDNLEHIAHPGERYVSVMPYVRSASHDEEKEARAIFTVVDALGEPVSGVEVIGRVRGTQSENFECKTGGDGSCEVKLDKVKTVDGDDEPTDPGLAWAWHVDAVVTDNMAVRPAGMLYASQGLEVITAALEESPELSQSALAIYWPRENDEELGELAESYTVLSGGTGIATSPMGIAFTPGAILGTSSIDTVTIDLDGTGIATSPMGTIPARLVKLGGEGIATSPIGLDLPPLLALHGTGIATSPLGLHPLGLTQAFEGTGIATSPLGIEGRPILMDTGTIIGASADSALSAHLKQGGWISEDHYAPTTLLSTSSLISDTAIMVTVTGSSTIAGSTLAGAGEQVSIDAVYASPLPVAE